VDCFGDSGDAWAGAVPTLDTAGDSDRDETADDDAEEGEAEAGARGVLCGDVGAPSTDAGELGAGEPTDCL